MQNNIKLKKLIEETFGYKCKEDCKYIYASSSEELGKKIREKIESAYKINGYEFTTNSGRRIGGSLPSQSAALENLGSRITDLKIGYMEVGKQYYDFKENPIQSFAFGILDPTKECVEMICNVGESKNIELSSYNDFASLQEAFINIIGEDENLEHSWNYIIIRQNENSFGKIKGTGKEKIKSIFDAVEDLKKHNEYIIAVSIRMNSYNNKTPKIKHYVLFMV